ncbi:MAG: hypothetical protein ACLQB1_16210 [Streptosporangiaceae bacterium]
MSDTHRNSAAEGGGPAVAPAVADGTGLARARQRFLAAQPLEPGLVRDTILASWQRSRRRNVAAGHIDPCYVRDPGPGTPLTRSALPVLQSLLGEGLEGQPVSVILTDARGVVLCRLTADHDLERHLDSIQLAPGFSYAEEFAGTNRIGTALESGQAAHVFGHEHYAGQLVDLACAAVPIRHPPIVPAASMKGRHMPNTSIYVPDDLAELVRHYGLSVSEVAQAALREAVNESGRHFRRELAYVALEHVKWREVVAGNYPDDPRNRQAVAALRALAEYILALEPDDSRLVHLRDSAEHARQLDSYVPETGEACGNWGRTLGSYGFYQDCTPEEGLRKLTEASDKDDAEWAALGADVLAEVTRSVARSLGFADQDAKADADPEEAARIVRGRRRGTYMYKSA